MSLDITDALIARTIQTDRMIEAGRDYWGRGAVRRLDVATDERLAAAAVQGSRPRPYSVTVQLIGDRDPAINASCTCPVGIGCKHIAATLFAVRAHVNDRAKMLDPHRERAPLLQPAPLPTSLAAWAKTMRPILQAAHSPSAIAASCRIVYIVRAQAIDSSTRSSAKKPPSMLVAKGLPLRLLVEMREFDIDQAGAPIGGGRKVDSYQLLYARTSASSALTSDDRLIGHRLQARAGDADYEGCLQGAGGFELFERIIRTGRAHFGGVRGVQLRWGEPVDARMAWQHDEHGSARLGLGGIALETIVGLLTPPVLVDLASGTVDAVHIGLDPGVAEQLLRMPEVPIAALDALALQWGDLAPASIPPPPQANIVELGKRTPTPVLSLAIEPLNLLDPTNLQWHYGRKVRVPSARARLTFDYGIAHVAPDHPGDRIIVRTANALEQLSRDREAEALAIRHLAATQLLPIAYLDGVYPSTAQMGDYVPMLDLPARPQDFAAFMLADAADLRDAGWRIEIADGFGLEIVETADDQFGVDLEPSGTDWFDLTLGATIDGKRVDLIPALTHLLSTVAPGEIDWLLREPDGASIVLPVILADGRVLAAPLRQVAPMLRALLLLASTEAQGTRVGTRDFGLIADLEAATSTLPWAGADTLRHLARSFRNLAFAPTALPSSVKATLRPYQQTGLDWLQALAEAGLGGLLADDMGLGKTVQTLAHLAVLKERGELDAPALIVAPTSVLPNWQTEAARFTPELSVLLLHGPGRVVDQQTVANHDVVITSYPLLIRDRAALAGCTFSLAVFDEAHNLKNPRTAGHAAARALIAPRKIALTGTPVENRLTDIWALFDLVVPGLLGSRQFFQRHYRRPIEHQGSSAARDALQRKLRPFLLRRTKDAVATDLPPKSLLPVHVTLTADQLALYDSQRLLMQERVRTEIARVGLLNAQIVVLTALTRLRQICCDPQLLGDEHRAVASAKRTRLLEMLEEMIPEGRRIILFSQFTSMLELIKPELGKRAFRWVEITGKTKDRLTAVQQFQAEDVPIILVSLKAGGTGLNLTAADTVILYDPWWNPAIEAQAIDRAHRIGQAKPVFVYRLIAKATIEEKILALQERKAALADALWSDDAATPAAGLTEEDVAFLLG